MAHKNRRMLKEGPGAGYPIKSYVRISKVNSFELDKVTAFRKSDYGYFAVTAEFNCDIDAIASDLRFSSYEYGGEISSEVPVKISKMEMDFTVAPFSDIEDESEYREKMSGVTEENVMQYVDINSVKETLISDNFETDIVYGGGWAHATYDGTLSTMKDYVDYNNASYNDYEFAIDKVDAKITDEEVIKYVDEVVSGENYQDSFGVYDENDELLDSFDDLDAAVEFAKENNGAYIERYTYEVKFDGELDFTSSVTVWYADDSVEESLKLREGTVNVSQEFVDKRDALADYLGIDKDKIRLTRFDDTFVTEDGDSYLVYTDDEATVNARNAVTDAIDDIGFNSFSENFKNEVIRQQLVDTDWFDDAMKESYEFYADDIKEEDGEHGNRLFDEMIENGIISEEDVTEDGELVDSVDFDEAKERFVQKLCDNWENGADWFIDNFGEEEFSKVCTQHSLFDYDEIADMAVEWDGRGHFLSVWDGDEIELPNGFYAYKQNENEDFDDADDIISESLKEDIKKLPNGKWANVGKDGKADSGKFKTKKEATAQMKAMYANGYKGESLEEAIHGKDDMETFLKMAKDIGINTLGELDTFLKNEKQPGDKDEWETMLRYRASLGNDFKIDPKKNEGLIDKIKSKIADAKKEKELKDTDDISDIIALAPVIFGNSKKDDKKPPKQGQKIRVDEADESNSNLSSLIDEWANSTLRKVDDHYEYDIDASYDDRFSDEAVIKALNSANPRDYLTDELFDSFVDYEFNIKSELTNDLEKFLKEKNVEYDFDELLELFDDKVSINLPYDDYFNVKYKCRIVVDTGDANYDFALNPCYNYDGEEIDSKASIIWLAKQQGYTEEDVKRALTTDDVNSLDEFLKSVLDEVLNTTTSLNSIVFLCTATLNQLIDQKENKLPITVSKNATCGLVDLWSGGGSVLGINLQKPVTIPGEYVYEFVPDVNTSMYSVDSIYGLTGGAYSGTVTVDGGSSKITESVSAVKNILNGLVSKDGKSIRAFRDDEKLPRGFRFKSGTGDHGEVSYRGTDYAYALVDGKLRVMPSSDAGWNWSETIYSDNYKESIDKDCDCEEPEYDCGDPEYDYEGELMDTDDDHGTESPYELGEEDFDDDFFADYWSREESSIDYDDDFKVEEKCNKGGKLTESLHIKDGKYVNSNDDEEIGFYGYMLKNTMTGTDFLIYSTDKDDLNSGVKETIDYLVKGVGSEKELMDKNVYIACDEDTYGFDTFDVDEDGKVTVFGDAIALVGSDSIRF